MLPHQAIFTWNWNNPHAAFVKPWPSWPVGAHNLLAWRWEGKACDHWWACTSWWWIRSCNLDAVAEGFSQEFSGWVESFKRTVDTVRQLLNQRLAIDVPSVCVAYESMTMTKVVYDNPLDNVGDLAHIFFQRCLEALKSAFVLEFRTDCPPTTLSTILYNSNCYQYFLTRLVLLMFCVSDEAGLYFPTLRLSKGQHCAICGYEKDTWTSREWRGTGAKLELPLLFVLGMTFVNPTSFAHVCSEFLRTVFKWQEGFWQKMKKVFDAEYKDCAQSRAVVR